MRRGEVVEGLLRIAAMGEIGAQQALDPQRHRRQGECRIEFATQAALRAGAAADVNDVALERLVSDLGAEQADVAHEMLRAGMGTAGEVYVDGPVERDAALEM